MSGWERHIGNQQPPDTRGMRVIYRSLKSEIIHKAHPADEINWKTTGPLKATIGAISEYRIIKNESRKFKKRR